MLVYRTILDLPSGKPVDLASRLFRDWLAEKSPGLEVPEMGSATAPGISVATASAADRPAFYGRMAEESDGGDVWTTTVMADAHSARWFCLDLERVSSRPHEDGPVPRPPRIVSRILDRADCFCGDVSVSAKPRSASSEIDPLLDELFHERRMLPIVVVSNRWGENCDHLDGVARQLAQVLAGIAHVWRIGEAATTALKHELGELAVWGGAVRIYRPKMNPDYAEGYRHPVIPFPRLRNTETALRAVHRIVLPLTAGRRQPASYEEVRLLPGFPGARQLAPDRDLEALYDEVEQEKELALSQLGEARRDLEGREFELELEREGITEAQRELQGASARVEYLEAMLREAGRQVFGAHDDPAPVEVDGCEDAVRWAEENLSHVEFCPDVSLTASGLDSHGKAGIWGEHARRAFQAFERYAAQKLADRDAFGDFSDFSERHDPSMERIPDNWIAMRESETVDNNPTFRDARTFTITPSVDGEASVYMPAHVKIQKGKPPAPRIHFYDDVMGSSGKVWVGYFGEHLPSTATN